MRVVDMRLAVMAWAAAALAAAATAPPAFAAGAPSSSAFGISAGVSSRGTGTALGAVAAVHAAGNAPYNRYALAPFASEALGLVSAGNLIGEVIVTGSMIASHASSTGVAKPTVTVAAGGSIGSLEVTIKLLPQGGFPAPPPLMTLTATKLATSLTDTRTLPSVSAIQGLVSFGSLTIGGSLFGATPLSFSGAASANTVLYEDPNITVTLNRQVETGSVECVPECAFIPYAMTAQALAITINGAKVLGKPFYGNIIVGDTQAAIP